MDTTTQTTAAPMIEHEAGLLAVLLAVLAFIFWATQQPATRGLFKIVPALVFCYFIPTTLTTLGVIPDQSPLYTWIKSFLLPASLLLLVLSLDVRGIIRLGPKAVIMLLAGTCGVVIGGPIALWICLRVLPDFWALPPDAWQGMAALSGSWIGGSANYIAIGQIAGADDEMMGLMVVPDVLVANIWMGALLFLSGKQHAIDAWSGANTQAIRDLEHRMTDFHERVSRIPTLPDLIMIFALGFIGSWLSYKGGIWLDQGLATLGENGATWVAGFRDIVSPTTWKFILVTTLGMVLSFTAVRNLEGAGASRIGSVMLYLLVACIGAGANFNQVKKAPGLVVAGFVWMAIHVAVLLTVARLIRAPMFFVAVGSQANIGGAASAPVVASAFHPSLAPVGVLLAVAGYVLGTYAGLLCMSLLQYVASSAT